MLTNLKTIRTARGLSQRALGRKSGISQPAIANIENGRRLYPRFDTVVRLARALGCDPSDFYNRPEGAKDAAA